MKKYDWKKAIVSIASVVIFSVTLADGDVTTTNTSTTPYLYSDPSYEQVGQPVQEEASSLTLNNQQLGLGGPITVSTGYTDNYGYELQASFNSMLGLYDAVGLLGAYASKENRIDITWAHAWTEKQRTKLSVERLAEKMEFDYDSGSTSAWVPQYSYGAAYQYLFNKNWLRNIEFSGYYANAQSKDLATVQFQSNSQLYNNYRHIAGATSEGSVATVNVSPWKTALVGLGVNYDHVNYDTKYEDTAAENANGLGFTLSLEQLLSKHVKLNLEGSQREVYNNYMASISFLTPADVEIGINGERTIGENGSGNDSRFNLNLAYFFDDHSHYENGYNLADVGQNDLASWASKSPAYMDEVLAAADQKTTSVISSSPTPTTGNLSATVPEIKLVAGEINQVDISTYMQSAHLTATQIQSVPKILGGPAAIKFTYIPETQSLVTTAVVPSSAINNEAAPLFVVFPADNGAQLTKQSLINNIEKKLSFKVTVTDNITPYLNPGFEQNLTAIANHAQTWNVYYENPSQPGESPQGPEVMFINPNQTSDYLMTTSSMVTKVPGTDPNNCYSAVSSSKENMKQQLLTITTVGSDVCPAAGGVVVFTVKGCNDVYCSSENQTIKITANPSSSPYVSGGVITNPISNSSYSYAFNTNEVSPGEGLAFSTENGANIVKVYDATVGCTDVTATGDFALGVTPSQMTLTSGNIPASLTGHALNIYMSVKNSEGTTYDNGINSPCSAESSPFTATVKGAPIIPNNIQLGDMAVGSSYTYNFMTQGGVTTGSSGLDATASQNASHITVKDADGNDVDATNLGLALTFDASNIKLTGNPSVGFAGDTVYATLTLTNTDGYTANNVDAPAYSTAIQANAANMPIVGNNQQLSEGMQYASYSHNFTSQQASPGPGETFSDDPTETYAIVTNPDGVGYNTQDAATSPFALSLVNGNTQLQLSSTNNNTLNIQGKWLVELHVTNNDHQSATNAGSPDYFNVVSSTDPMYQPYVAGNLALTDGELHEQYPGYTFATTDVYAGEAGSNETFKTDVASTYAVVTDPNGVVYTTQDTANSPFALSFSNDDTQISLNGVAGKGVDTQGQWSVVLYVTNKDGATAFNATPEHFTVNAPTVYDPQIGTTGVPLTNADIDGSATVPYNYSYGGNPPMLAGPEGSEQTFDTTNTKALVYYDAAKTQPVTGDFSLVFSTDDKIITALSASQSTIAGLKAGSTLYIYYQAANTGNPTEVISSTVPDTIATDEIVIPTTTIDTWAVAESHTYDFSANNNLTLGSTGLDADPTASTATFSDPNAGLAAIITNNNIVVSGTLLAGHATGPITLTLNLKTPAANGGSFSKTIAITIPTSASTPAAEAKEALPPVNVGSTFPTYTYSNDTKDPIYAYAGAGETFSSESSAVVTGSVSGPLTEHFKLVPFNSGTQLQLQSADGYVFTQNEELTVTLHLVNQDVANAQDQSGGTVVVNSTTGTVYLTCPYPEHDGGSSDANHQSPYYRSATSWSSLMSAATGGSELAKVTFNRTAAPYSSNPQETQLNRAVLSGKTLICYYVMPGALGRQGGVYDYVAETTVPATGSITAQGSDGWESGTVCMLGDAGHPTATSCQISYTVSSKPGHPKLDKLRQFINK